MPPPQSPPLTDAQAEQLKRSLEKRPVKFQIRTGSGKWACTVYPDRASYERFKTERTNSTSSISSLSSVSSTTTTSAVPASPNALPISAVAMSPTGTSTPESK